jgi:pimeloyl-ACP methyl ester carboxylesterase
MSPIASEKMADDILSLSRRDFVGTASALGLIVAGATSRPGAAQAAPPDENPAQSQPPKSQSQGVSKVDKVIDRGFLRVSEGLIHYRSAGERRDGGPLPLYVAHPGPGSSLGMVGLLLEFAPSRFAVAPDMLGNGDSAPPASDKTDMTYYADCAIRTLDLLKIEKCDFYGSHTGAQIGCEVAARWPDRVRRLVLDGLPLFPDDFKQQLLANYAPKVEPDEYGGHLAWAWNFVRDQFLYWPHYAHDGQNRLANSLLPPKDLHSGVVDVLKALDTYRIAYQAAFAQDVRALLPRIKAPVLLTSTERDPLHIYLDDVAALLPGAHKILFARGVSPADRVAPIRTFLDA